MELRILEKDYKIHVYETGPDGKLSLHSLFDFLQDIASDHAVKLGYGRDDLMKQNHFWVFNHKSYVEILVIKFIGSSAYCREFPVEHG